MNFSVSSLLDSDIRNAKGEDVGRIEGLMIDSSSGEVRRAIVSLAGRLGYGDAYIAIPIKTVAAGPRP